MGPVFRELSFSRARGAWIARGIVEIIALYLKVPPGAAETMFATPLSRRSAFRVELASTFSQANRAEASAPPEGLALDEIQRLDILRDVAAYIGKLLVQMSSGRWLDEAITLPALSHLVAVKGDRLDISFLRVELDGVRSSIPRTNYLII